MIFYALATFFILISNAVLDYEVISQQPIQILKQNKKTNPITFTITFRFEKCQYCSNNFDYCDVETFNSHVEIKEINEKKILPRWKKLAQISQKKELSEGFFALGITFDYKWGNNYHFKVFPVISKHNFDNLKKVKFFIEKNIEKLEIKLIKVDDKTIKNLKKLFLKYLETKKSNHLENRIH